jgi:pimeloyl-ACP methyl ester carboxylesterase
VAEFEHYVQVYDATGFTGGLNWYRALDANWADDSVEGKPIEVPTLFLAGSNEPIISIVGPSVLDTMRESVTDLRGVHLVDGAGHWLQQEQAYAVNELLLDFLAGL